jgi:hypothetical protein
MTDDDYLHALNEAMARATDQGEIARLMHELDRFIENKTRRARSLPPVERR